MGFRYTLVLNREISDEESALLREAGCADAVFGADSLPTNAEVRVTRVDVDDCVSVSLEAAIEAGLGAVQKVPDLSVPGLTVPAQPAFRSEADNGEVIRDSVIEETAIADVAAEDRTASEEPAAEKTIASKPAAKKTSAKKAGPEKVAATSAAG